ncbi:MAG: ATP-binding protein, partial [Candidatus Moraniibacteriota bacterium]
MTLSLKTKRGSSMKRFKKSAPSSKRSSLIKPLSQEGRSLTRRFQTRLAEENMLPKESKILVAVSGGPDSQALLFLLFRLAKKYVWHLHVAHV